MKCARLYVGHRNIMYVYRQFDKYSEISWKKCETGCKLHLLLLEVALELSIRARIGDLEWPRSAYWPCRCLALSHRNRYLLGANYVKMVEFGHTRLQQKSSQKNFRAIYRVVQKHARPVHLLISLDALTKCNNFLTHLSSSKYCSD